jgi:hypothetical protein
MTEQTREKVIEKIAERLYSLQNFMPFWNEADEELKHSWREEVKGLFCSVPELCIKSERDREWIEFMEKLSVQTDFEGTDKMRWWKMTEKEWLEFMSKMGGQ